MNYLKHMIVQQFRTYSIISVSIVLSILLLMILMTLNHSYFSLFLMWNLLLTVIPFTITNYLLSNPKLNTNGVILWVGVWLLFLPNAPYLTTDLLHLKLSTNHFLWLDVIVLTSFALNGLLMLFLSLRDMEEILGRYIHTNHLCLLHIIVLFLCGFGVYLGRFLRYNSWEIIQKPFLILKDIRPIVLNPSANYEAWLFTFILGGFLMIGFWVFKLLFDPAYK